MPDEVAIWQALHDVKDPEIPTISLVDLGVVTGVEVAEDGAVRVTMTPTFVGCPALDYMKRDVEERLRAMGIERFAVEVNLDVPWSSNLVTEEGRKRLLEHGLAPPPRFDGVLELTVLNDIACPFCGSRETTLQSPFGPTLCRTIHYCRSCSQAFEGFKPV
jgi:ring-1,2-phenylacetyl-CoA epoxidase subunit PaaD